MKSVLVTAAFSNLGQTICRLFHGNGYFVYGTTTRKDVSSPFVDKIIVIDLCREKLSSDGIDELDVLVNNAGIFTESHIENLSDEDYGRVFDLNVKAAFFTIQAMLPALKKKDGSVVNISSMNAVHPGFGSTAHYDATKGAVSAMTRSLASETGLRINAVQPGLIARPALEGSSLEEHWKSHSVMKRMMEPDEIARLVLFLAQSSGIYGQCVTIDNGYMLC